MIIIYTCFDWMTGHKPHLGQLRSRAASQRWDWLHPSPYPACANLCHSIEWEYNQQVYAYKWLYHNLFNVIVIYSLGHCPPAYRVYNPIWLHDPCFTCHLSFQHTSIPIFFMRRAPARPVRACFVRICCAVVVKGQDPHTTTLHCKARWHFAFQWSHLKLHTLHSTLLLISSELFSPRLSS